MNDMNRLLIFLLLVGLLYALYKYQHIIFGNNVLKLQITKQDTQTGKLPINDISRQIKYKQVTTDNISQISLHSLDDENDVYKAESLPGSFDNCSLNSLDLSLDSKL